MSDKKTSIEVSRDNVLIKPHAALSETKSGLTVIEGEKVSPKVGAVIKVGPGFYNKKGNFVKPPCDPGDYVIYAQGQHHTVELFDEKFVVVPAESILLILK